MRDNYVGDVGDFYKYSLLRRLCGATGEGPKRKLGKRELAERLGYNGETEAFYFPKWGGRISV